MKKFLYLTIAIITILCCACNGNDIQRRLEEIKSLGDNDPEKALCMLDSIGGEINDNSEYVRMKYRLLKIRLKDKAFVTAKSDDEAKAVYGYFEKDGTASELQEAYYYTGSVYRDLNDTPRALEFFLKAEEVAMENEGCDSTMLRNTYSNMFILFFEVQNYTKALEMAKQEYEISRKINDITIFCLSHKIDAYLRLDSIREADSISCIAENYADTTSAVDMYALLYNFSTVGNAQKAEHIHNIIKQNNIKPTMMGYFALAEYYKLSENKDSVISNYAKIIDESNDVTHTYDASRFLFDIYREEGNNAMCLKYAQRFMETSDTLDLGKRQELAATVNNRFQYFRNMKEERQTIMQKEKYKRIMLWLAVTLLILSLSYLMLHLYNKNKHLSEILKLGEDLTHTRESLENAREQLAEVNNEIDAVERELEVKEKMLNEKLEENKRFVSLLHKVELEEKAGDVIMTIKEASKGKHKMTAEEWRKFYHAVDEQQPELMQKIMHNLGKFTEQQQQVCYLLSIGLSNIQIENLTDIPHVTVWRWVKKFTWI